MVNGARSSELSKVFIVLTDLQWPESQLGLYKGSVCVCSCSCVNVQVKARWQCHARASLSNRRQDPSLNEACTQTPGIYPSPCSTPASSSGVTNAHWSASLYMGARELDSVCRLVQKARSLSPHTTLMFYSLNSCWDFASLWFLSPSQCLLLSPAGLHLPLLPSLHLPHISLTSDPQSNLLIMDF